MIEKIITDLRELLTIVTDEKSKIEIEIAILKLERVQIREKIQ